VLCQTFLPKLASKINCNKTRIYLFPVPMGKIKIRVSDFVIFRILAIIECISFILGIAIGSYVEQFRGHPEYGWLYQEGKPASLHLCFLAFIIMIITILGVLNNTKERRKKNKINLILTLFPIWFLIIANILSYMFSFVVEK
jgi:hypothetical protein